jgi:hypothetical protein
MSVTPEPTNVPQEPSRIRATIGLLVLAAILLVGFLVIRQELHKEHETDNYNEDRVDCLVEHDMDLEYCLSHS